MTEDEAKGIACCKGGGSTITENGPCIASHCAAWRWKEAKRTELFVRAVVEHMKASGDNYSKALQEVVKRRDEFAYTDGYCGLAGGEGAP